MHQHHHSHHHHHHHHLHICYDDGSGDGAAGCGCGDVADDDNDGAGVNVGGHADTGCDYFGCYDDSDVVVYVCGKYDYVGNADVTTRYQHWLYDVDDWLTAVVLEMVSST